MIPKSFKLNNVEWTVKINEDNANPFKDDTFLFGTSNMCTAEININKTIDNVKQSDARLENTFYHELAHALFNEAAIVDESIHTEPHIQALGTLIQEFMNTYKK